MLTIQCLCKPKLVHTCTALRFPAYPHAHSSTHAKGLTLSDVAGNAFAAPLHAKRCHLMLTRVMVKCIAFAYEMMCQVIANKTPQVSLRYQIHLHNFGTQGGCCHHKAAIAQLLWGCCCWPSNTCLTASASAAGVATAACDRPAISCCVIQPPPCLQSLTHNSVAEA